MSPTTRTSHPSAVHVLADSLLFGELDEGSLRAIARASVVGVLAEGDAVWTEGAVATSFSVLNAGLVKLGRSLSDGSEDIVGTAGPRESLCEADVFEGRAHRVTAVVVGDRAEVLRVDAVAVRDRLENHPKFANAIGRVLLDHTRRLHEKIRVLSAGPVAQRLATLLLALAERFGEPGEDGVLWLPLPLRRSELAGLIGARVETTIRCIRPWERADIVETTSRGIVLRNLPVLRAAAMGEVKRA